jgi:hypothetical protein
MKNVSQILTITFLIASGALLLTTLSACAEKELKQKVSSDVAAEPLPASRSDLQKESEALINNSQFSDDQKNQLRSLRKDLLSKMQSLNDESLKIRSLLLKEVIAKHGDELEVSALEDKMKDNSQKKLKVLFEAVKKTNRILGRNSIEQDRLKIFDDIIMIKQY